jgi:hypothetical protein
MKAIVKKALASNPPVEQDQVQSCTEETEENQLDRRGSNHNFDWKVVDIVGSPGLGRLIGALTVETCNYIPFLDLARGEFHKLHSQDISTLCYKIDIVGSKASHQAECSDESTEARYSQAPQGSPCIWPSMFAKSAHNSPNANSSWTFHLNFPYNELYPFPSRPSTTWAPPQEYFFPTTSSEWTELECKRQFKRLGSIEGEEVARLVASIAKIGFKYRTLSEYRIAEKWYRCIVTATEGMRDRRPIWILAACLGVILCLNMQGRYAEA